MIIIIITVYTTAQPDAAYVVLFVSKCTDVCTLALAAWQ
jgi:hypothetical protein